MTVCLLVLVLKGIETSFGTSVDWHYVKHLPEEEHLFDD